MAARPVTPPVKLCPTSSPAVTKSSSRKSKAISTNTDNDAVQGICPTNISNDFQSGSTQNQNPVILSPAEGQAEYFNGLKFAVTGVMDITGRDGVETMILQYGGKVSYLRSNPLDTCYLCPLSAMLFIQYVFILLCCVVLRS